MAIKLLDHFKNALILPHKCILMKLVVRYIKDCFKAFEHYNSVVQMNCKPGSELPFDTKDQLKIISNHIIDYLQTIWDSVKIYGVFNKPKPHDRLFFILKKLNYFLQIYLLEMKYWQILQPADLNNRTNENCKMQISVLITEPIHLMGKNKMLKIEAPLFLK